MGRKRTPKFGRGEISHPWDDWFSTREFTLRHGRDYWCKDYSMAQQVRNAATRKGYTVSISIGEGQLTVSVARAKRA